MDKELPPSQGHLVTLGAKIVFFSFAGRKPGGRPFLHGSGRNQVAYAVVYSYPVFDVIPHRFRCYRIRVK